MDLRNKKSITYTQEEKNIYLKSLPIILHFKYQNNL